MSEPEPTRRGLPWLAFASGMLLAVGVGYALLGHGDPDSAAPAVNGASEAAPAPPAPAETPAPTVPPIATHSIAPSGTLELDHATLPSSGPVRVSLELPHASSDAEPPPVQVFSEDSRVFETQGRLDDTRSAATIDLEASWLRPGSYVVQMKTAEPSVMALRRYLIVVR